MTPYRYPLQTDNFSWIDRLKVAGFILNKKNRLTSGPKVKELEKEWEAMTGAHTVATSSGSTANHLLVETFLQEDEIDPSKVVVFAPSTTWSSSISPWLMRGCKVVLVDINLSDFSFDYKKLEREVSYAKYRGKVKVIWPTSLIGHVPDIANLHRIAARYEARLFGDFCETTMGSYSGYHVLNTMDMCSTSFFWAHQICSVEGGMLFTKSRRSQQTAQMIRSHGLTRVLGEDSPRLKDLYEKNNQNIDPAFLFQTLGTNYRMSDIHAYFGILDTKKYKVHEKHRKKIWKYFCDNAPNEFLSLNPAIVPFCLPFILDPERRSRSLREIKRSLAEKGWETRPVISYLPINPAFRHLDKGDYPNSSFLHRNGLYVGINPSLTTRDLDSLFKTVRSAL